MVKKVEKCLYCGEKMGSQTAKKRFCTAKCRVYWNRMKVAADKVGSVLQDLTKPTNEVKPTEQPKSNYVVNTERHPLWKEGDPKEGSMAFIMKYDAVSYLELENKQK